MKVYTKKITLFNNNLKFHKRTDIYEGEKKPQSIYNSQLEDWQLCVQPTKYGLEMDF